MPPQPTNSEFNSEPVPHLMKRGAVSPSDLKIDGMVRITGAGHDLLVEFRDTRVARFRRTETQKWSESGKNGRLASPIVVYEADRLRFAWTFCESAADGRDAILQELLFEGTPQPDGTVQGHLSLRMIARFLKPQVVLADFRGPALLVLADNRGATHAA